MDIYTVKGHKDLARDPNTNNIVNVNNVEYDQYIWQPENPRTKRMKRYRI